MGTGHPRCLWKEAEPCQAPPRHRFHAQQFRENFHTP